jgi:hypothetical protein
VLPKTLRVTCALLQISVTIEKIGCNARGMMHLQQQQGGLVTHFMREVCCAPEEFIEGSGFRVWGLGFMF